MSRALQAAAWDALHKGWWIFPCEPDGKQPATLHGWKDAAPDARPWESHWGENYNIGIACGPSGLLVADLDVKNGIDGVTAFEEWAGEWPDTYEVETPSGGVHLYFSDPVGNFSNGTGNLPKGIDIRGRGGYVLGAGSVIGGKCYRVVNDNPVLPVPAYLAKGLSAPRPRPRRNMNIRGDRRWETLPALQVVDALNRILDRVAESPPGERNNVLFWAACRFGEAMAAERIDYEKAVDELLGVAYQCGLADEDGEYAVLATIESGISQE
jgi:hypothetical protein